MPLAGFSKATADDGLKVVIIRHGEKPENGDNLSCQGENRALQLPAVLYCMFGSPDYTYVPSLGLDDATKHARMFQTVSPFAIQYNLTINSKYGEKKVADVAKSVQKKTGTVLLVWEHSAIPELIDFDKPTARVYMGSYNFSKPADNENGENLLLIKDRRIAVSYMIQALTIFDHYHFRVLQAKADASSKPIQLKKAPKTGQKPWWDEDYTDPRKILDRELFA